MYTCPGSIELGDRTLSWDYEEGVELRKECLKHDLDFRTSDRHETGLEFDSILAFARFRQSHVRLSCRRDYLRRFDHVMDLPPDSSLDDIVNAVVTWFIFNGGSQ